MPNERITKEKFYEFINYLEKEENEIPTPNIYVPFIDGTNMGNFFTNHNTLIKSWVYSEESKNYMVAANKLSKKISLLEEKRNKRKQLVMMRERILSLNSQYFLKMK